MGYGSSLSVRKARLIIPCLILVAAMGPVYWLPYVPPASLALSKLLIFVLFGALSALLLLRTRLDVPSLIALLSFLLLAALSSLLHQDPFVLTAILISAFLVLGRAIRSNLGRSKLIESLAAAYYTFVFLAAVLVVDWALGGLFYNPFYDYPIYLFESGYQGGRTGSSVALNLFLGLGFVLFLLGSMRRDVFLFAQSIIGSNILFIGARGGLLVAVLLVATFFGVMICRRGVRALPGLFLFLVILVLGAAYGAEYLVELRAPSLLIETLEGGTQDATGGRVEGYLIALDLFLSAPLSGQGTIVLLDYGMGYESIHNVWIKLVSERGLVLASAFLLLIAILILRGLLDKALGRLIIIFPCGALFLSSFFEPTVFMGNFYSSAFFWILLGAAGGGSRYGTLPYSSLAVDFVYGRHSQAPGAVPVRAE